MQITVELQDMFSYSVIGVIFFIVLLLIPLVLFIQRKRKEAPLQSTPVMVQSGNMQNIFGIKNKYRKLLMDIEQKYLEQKISDKVAYQELSAAMRFFVYELTGIKAQNYTLEEIKNANVPRLYELVAEYYVPEFATEHNNKIQDSLIKARKVIDEWS